jgi:hypothetical protein
LSPLDRVLLPGVNTQPAIEIIDLDLCYGMGAQEGGLCSTGEIFGLLGPMEVEDFARALITVVPDGGFDLVW